MSVNGDGNSGTTGGKPAESVKLTGPFIKNDPRINRRGRKPISELQREFRRKLHDMEPDVLAAASRLLKQRKPDPHTTGKLVDKLGGPDAINVKLAVDKELSELLEVAKETLGEDAYEKLAEAFVAKTSGGG